MGKLALYFSAQKESCRVLDTDFVPENYIWSIGRAANSSIRFQNSDVSKRHASLRAVATGALDDENEMIFDWQLRDEHSTNGTYLDGRRLIEDHWFPLAEGDVVDFASPAARIKFSFDIDETFKSRRDTDPGEATEGGQGDGDGESSEEGHVPWQTELIRTLKQTPNHRLAMYGVLGLLALVVWIAVPILLSKN